MASVPVALVEASNQLSNLQRPLSRVQDPLTKLPAVSSVPGRVGQYGEVTRAHRSVATSDAGLAFNTARMQSELYPIEGPICDLRGTFQVFGEATRYDGRDPYVL